MAALPPGVDLCQIPAAAPPAGQVPNFVNPESLATTTIAVSSVMLALTFAFASARIWVNRHKLRLSDYFTIIAFLLETGFTGIILSLNPYNRHQWNVPVCMFNDGYLKRLYAEIILFGATLFFSKAAIFLLYREIFGIKSGMRIAVAVGLVVAGLLYGTFLPMGSIYQAPRAGQPWSSLLLVTDHTPLEHWGIVIGCGSVLLDCFIFVLPLPIVINLNVTTNKRLQLVAVFGTAMLGVAASIVAVVYRVQLLRDDSDSTWGQAAVALANLIENGIAIIVGSAPAFSTFLRMHVVESRVWQSIRSTFGGATSNNSRGGYNNNNGGSKDSAGRPARPLFNTFGSPRMPQRNKKNGGSGLTTTTMTDYELSDTQILKSDIGTRYDRLNDEESPVVQVVGGAPVAAAVGHFKESVQYTTTPQTAQRQSGGGVVAPAGAIVRTMDIYQQETKHTNNRSTDQLV